MIERIGTYNSYGSQNQNNISFGMGPMIIYGVPSRFDFPARIPRRRDEVLIKYGIPDRPINPGYNDDENEEPPLIKYGIPDSDDINEEDRPARKTERKALYKYGIPDISRRRSIQENDDEDTETVVIPKPKRINIKQKNRSYFKRLWLAILGKDA